LLDFARNVAKSLPPTASGVRIAGDPEAIITRVALCAGAGDSFIANALDSDADVYVTSDLRHHPVSEALEEARARGRNFALVDISHWSAESLWLAVAASQLQELFPDVKFVISDLRTDPWDFAVTQ
jgi:putative NIF3 family GTP cyclohydrolase 1 type 2